MLHVKLFHLGWSKKTPEIWCNRTLQIAELDSLLDAHTTVSKRRTKKRTINQTKYIYIVLHVANE